MIINRSTSHQIAYTEVVYVVTGNSSLQTRVTCALVGMAPFLVTPLPVQRSRVTTLSRLREIAAPDVTMVSEC